MRSNRKNTSKYTIGPHGEIYNNNPQLSERTMSMLKSAMLESALEEALSDIEEEENNNGDQGTSEEGNKSLCD